jgi:catechol 2,3-dioxygenase-like lactoylglutathione lyase family enzyme
MKIVLRQIEHVQMVVPIGKLEEARKFYLGVLGFEEVPMPASFAGRAPGFWCQSNGVMVHVGQDAETKRTKAHPAFDIENVAGVRKYLEGLGVKTFSEPVIPGRERFTFRDPFENRIEFLELGAEPGSSS